MLSIRMLGEFEIRGAASPVRSRFAQGLLAYLATATRPVLRDVAADMLWDRTKVRNARHSLSQILYDLRNCLPAGCLVTDSHTLFLNGSTVRVDLRDFNAALASADLRLAISLFRGPFLAHFPYISDAYDDWRAELAALTQAEVAAAFNSLLGEHLDREDYASAATLAQTALIVSPADAKLVRVRVEALAASGDVARALRELSVARSRLGVELGHVPHELPEDLSSTIAKLASVEPQQQVAASLHVQLIGRSDELALIRNHWRSGVGSSKVIAINGPPGIGKSRLHEHVLRRCVLNGDRIFSCRCSEAEMRLPYGAFVEALRSGLRSSDAARLPSSWINIIASIAPELFPDSSPAHGCTQRSLWTTICRLFADIALNGPVVIGIDNYHWADEASKDLLRYVLAQLADTPLLLLVSQRGDVNTAVDDDPRSRLEITLGELSGPDTQELISAAEKQYAFTLPLQHRHALASKIGGHPYFMLEALRQAASEDPNGTQTAVSFAITNDMRRYLHDKLSAGGPTALRLLDALAILNRPAPLHLLSKVTGLSPHEATLAVEELVSQGIIADAAEIRFSHDILLEACRLRVRSADAALWHARIADVMVESSEARYAETAYHFESAQMNDEAYFWASKARDQALGLHAPVEAEQQFLRVIRCSSNSQKVRAEADYVLWLARCGRMLDIAPFVDRLKVACSGDHDVQLTLALAEYERLEMASMGPGSSLLEAALKIIRYSEAHASTMLPSVLWQVTDTLRRQREFEVISELARLSLARDDSMQESVAIELKSVAALLQAVAKGHRGARYIANMAVHQAVRLGDPILLAKTYFARGTISLWAGRISDAGRDYQLLSKAAEPMGPDSLIARMHSNRCVQLFEENRLDDAEAQARVALAEVPGARRGYVFGNMALIALAKDDPARAIRYAEALKDWGAKLRHDWIPAHAHALLGLAELRLRNIAVAREHAEKALESLPLAEGMMDTSHAHLLIARILELTDSSESALDYLGRATVRVRVRDCLAGARLHLERARLVAESGPTAQARETVTRVERLAERYGARRVMQEARDLLQRIAASP